MLEFQLRASHTSAAEEIAEHCQVRRQHASVSVHGQSWRKRVLIFFSSLSQKSEEDGLKPAFILRCQHQILTKLKGVGVKCCLSSFYLSFPTNTIPFLKAPLQDVFLRCQNFPLPVPDIVPMTQMVGE